MKLNRLLAMALLSTLLFSVSCSREAATSGSQAGKETGKLVLTGSSTIAPLAAEIGKRFESRHPGVRVDVQTGGSSRGIADARQGLADIGMASRALEEDEKDLIPFTIARDGIGIILQRDNLLPGLTDRQVVSIYRGALDNWKKVGGKEGKITVVNKAEGRGTLEVFLHYFQLKDSQVHADVIIGDNEQAIKVVAGNPGAIGYVSIGTAEHDIADGVAIRLPTLDGVAATSENVASGKFPLSRPLNLVTRHPPKGLARQFINFARSPEVNDIIHAQDFVPPKN